MVNKADKNQARLKRHKRVRGKISGTSERPRLNVYRSKANIYAQIIDDTSGHTLVSASSYEKDFGMYGGNKTAAKKVGKNIKNIVFDRGGYLFHGRVKELAEGARESGLEF